MWKTTVAIAIHVALIGCMAMAGCFINSQATDTTAEASGAVEGILKTVGSAPAGTELARNMRGFFSSGLAFIILGGIVTAFGGRGTGVVMLLMGVITTGTGVLVVQYPWAVLVLVALLALVLAAVAIDRVRKATRLHDTDKVLEVIAEEVQTNPAGQEIKAGLKSRGTDVVHSVRRIIDPAKANLKRAGKIP